MDIEQFLTEQGIAYQRYDHPAVFTCEEAERHVPDIPAAKTKNVFLTDQKGRRHFLVVVGYEKSIDLAALGPLLDAQKLRLASPRRLQEYLGVDPGSVTLLGLVNDRERAVELVLDVPIAEAAAVRCHPLINTATLSIGRDGMRKFLEATGHVPRVIDVPGRWSDS